MISLSLVRRGAWWRGLERVWNTYIQLSLLLLTPGFKFWRLNQSLCHNWSQLWVIIFIRDWIIHGLFFGRWLSNLLTSVNINLDNISVFDLILLVILAEFRCFLLTEWTSAWLTSWLGSLGRGKLSNFWAVLKNILQVLIMLADSPSLACLNWERLRVRWFNWLKRLTLWDSVQVLILLICILDMN